MLLLTVFTLIAVRLIWRIKRKEGKMLKKSTVGIVMVFMVLVIWVVMAVALEIPRISKEELKPMLGNPDVVVIDVRAIPDHNKSVKQIKGAVREDPDPTKAKSWANKYSKDKTIVLYCA